MDACTLLLPGLGGGTTPMEAGFAAAAVKWIEDLDLDSFSRLYARGTRDHCGISGNGPEALCCAWFGVLPDAVSGDWPLAGLAWLGDDRNQKNDSIADDLNDHPALHNAGCVRIEPVHLQPGTAGLVATDPTTLGLQADESKRLAELVAPVFAAANLVLHTPLPSRWYLTAPAAVRMQTTPLSESIGVADAMLTPRGPDAPQWMRLLNQVQMLWHDCDVNQQREQHQELPINSLWISGTGSPLGLPSRCNPPDLVISDEATAVGIAALLGIASMPLAGEAAALPMETPSFRAATSAVVIDPCLYRPAKSGDWGGWCQQLENIHRRWIVTAEAALRTDCLQQLEIIDEHGVRLRIGANASQHWWHWPRSLLGWWKPKK